MKNVVVVGASGAIGSEFVTQFAAAADVAHVHALSRGQGQQFSAGITNGQIDLANEASIMTAAELAARHAPLDVVIVATGILHYTGSMPEKSIRDLSPDRFATLFEVNATGPALVMKHFIPKMRRRAPCAFAAISARVGSISDNSLGGWHAYRASKAALNMLIKNAAIEAARRNKHSIIVGLHPGTVDSRLSRPFHRSVKPGQLFSPAESVSRMMNVLSRIEPSDSGKFLSYDGTEIPA